MNLAKLAEDSIQRNGEYTLLHFGGKQYTNVELFEKSKRFHRAFSNLGVKKGSNILLCLMNSPLIYPIFEGIFRTGATAVPVMFLLTSLELKYILKDSEAEGIITDYMNLDKIREAVKDNSHVKWILVQNPSVPM